MRTRGGSVAAARPPLHTLRFSRRTIFNRVFAAVYISAVFALLYRHLLSLLASSSFISSAFLLSDILLAFIWATSQAFRMRPVYRYEFIDDLRKSLSDGEADLFPAMDVFLCTADPHKEPPMSVVNTALSVMAYDYPAEKISLYVSDDGGSVFTLFAFMEAAKFASHWLPFCKEGEVIDRNPEAYFASNRHWSPATEQIKNMYESMKVKVESVLARGKVSDEDIIGEQDHTALDKWTTGFTRHDHPTVVQVLLETGKDRDISGAFLPNLIYVSRQKSTSHHHHYKAGALNALLRVSATMTNSPVILTLDCDMYSNDPGSALRALCYFSDPSIRDQLGYVQFPQRYQGINKDDIYASEIKQAFIINPGGMDGFLGPNYVGTGCFFARRVFFGGPSSFELPELSDLGPYSIVSKPIHSPEILAQAYRVAACEFERGTKWGSKVGFRYGSLVEDFYTGFRLKCEGWRAVFCNPERAAFYGGTPISFADVLSQQKRWAVGLLEVAFSKYSPITFGTRHMGLLMGLMYSHYSFWPISSIAVTTYAFLPQLALINGIPIFPEVSELWFFLYVFLFIGAYGQGLLDFILSGSSFRRWWNDQRMWLVRALSAHLFGLVDFFLTSLRISTPGFNVTSKVLDGERTERYERQIFEFGSPSPIFVPLTTAAIINLAAFSVGFVKALKGDKFEVLLLQIMIAGFGVVNCWPVYSAMALRVDNGRIPTKITVVSVILAWLLYKFSSCFSSITDRSVLNIPS